MGFLRLEQIHPSREQPDGVGRRTALSVARSFVARERKIAPIKTIDTEPGGWYILEFQDALRVNERTHSRD